MKKRLLSAFLCAAMLATMIPAAFASDLDGHWSKNFIEYLDDEGIINPSATTGKYEPERKVTRAEFMRYVNRAFHFTEKASISYSDVQSNSWYYDTVRIAEKYGYINGTGNGRMNPEGYVTREQAAVILGRLYKANPGNVKPANLSFKDKAQVATWSAGYVKATRALSPATRIIPSSRPRLSTAQSWRRSCTIPLEPRFRRPAKPIPAPTSRAIPRTSPSRKAARCPMRRSTAICT